MPEECYGLGERVWVPEYVHHAGRELAYAVRDVRRQESDKQDVETTTRGEPMDCGGGPASAMQDQAA
jgi:hypothetical protein